MRHLFLLGGCTLLLAGGAYAQSSIGPATLNAGGGSAAIGANTYEWSIGEMTMVSTATAGTALVVTQGVLQPLDQPVSIDPKHVLRSLLQVFPNPASDVLHVAYTPAQSGRLTLLLTDIAGRRLLSETHDTRAGRLFSATLNMQPYAQGQYLLTAWEGNSQKGKTTFKINKVR